jgi:NitT/TauT family transport system ATP-binding protein
LKVAMVDLPDLDAGAASPLTPVIGPIISLSHVRKEFNGQTAVDDLSLAVKSGEVLTLLGQTGAGKTTVFSLIMGQIAPSAGRVLVDGCNPHTDFYALRGKVAVSFQSDRLIPWRTARENVELGLEILRHPKAARPGLAADWLNRVKLAPSQHGKYPHQLSGGMRQRVSLARAMVVDPDLVLLDESFSQLDPVTSRSLRHDFLGLIRQMRKTCVLITHRIEDAVEMSDRIVVLAAPGRIVLELSLTAAERNDPAPRAAATGRIASALEGVQH